MRFLKSTEVSLSGGYLTKSGDMNIPVNHYEFVAKQREAHIVVKLAEKVKSTDFTVKKVPSFNQLMEQVRRENSEEEIVNHISLPVEPERPLASKLKDEAMSWLNYEGAKSQTEKVNMMLQKFNIISDFENVGLYFNDEVVKLQRLYTMKEISDAMVILAPHLDQ